MAPEIAFKAYEKLPKASIIVDPMCGSGTTLRAAIDHGLRAIGSDLDPLAVLIARVNTTHLDTAYVTELAREAVAKAQTIKIGQTNLPWIDGDEETKRFIDFWFAQKQIEDLRKLAMVILRDYDGAVQDFMKVALSRLIVTKEQGASLARDTSHSRPHRVSLTNNYDVLSNFLKSVDIVARRLPGKNAPRADVRVADARHLSTIPNASVDQVITSPPYLNAIDYMRGNKLSLVWLGHKIGELGEIRRNNIGAERRLEEEESQKKAREMSNSIYFYPHLPDKQKRIFDRYLVDMLESMQEISRILKPGSNAILVVGNSNLKGVFIENTMAASLAASMVGLELIRRKDRILPTNSRYLPPPSSHDPSSLAKRMRTEAVMTFRKVQLAI